MKRLLCAILSIIFLICLYGCKNADDTDISVPVNFYYCSDPISYDSVHGVIAPEIRDAEDTIDSLERLIGLYLKGPVSDQFKSPFPEGVTVIQLSEANGSVHIVLSKEFAELSGLDLTLARACLAKTIMELAQVEYVQISFESANSTSRQTITVGPDSFLFSTDTVISTEPEE